MKNKLFSEPKIVHIVIDDKFIDIGLCQFEEVAPGKNYPVILSLPVELQYVKHTDVHFHTYAAAITMVQSEMCAAVVFHSLNERFISLLGSIPKGKQVFWLGWGFDYYGRLLLNAYPDGLLLPKTRLLTSYDSIISQVRRKARVLVNRLRGKEMCFIPKLMNRVDYFCPVLNIEYEMVKKFNLEFKPRYLCWNYGTLEEDFSIETNTEFVLGRDILVGNSATPENNHIEVFDHLRNQIGIQGRKIIVPLSYGDERYRALIMTAGREYFGEQFVPLVDFMPKEKYIHLLDGCGFMFINHLRQQAIGNIVIMMMKGAKIFMSPRGLAYQWFVNKGAVVYSLDDLVSNDSQVWNSLDVAARLQNIEILKQHWGKKIQKDKTLKLVEIALSSIKSREVV